MSAGCLLPRIEFGRFISRRSAMIAGDLELQIETSTYAVRSHGIHSQRQKNIYALLKAIACINS